MKHCRQLIAATFLLLLVGCAAPKPRRVAVEMPPLPPVHVFESSVSYVAPPVPTRSLFWEHDAGLTPGFTVERTQDFQTWETIGFVSVTNIYVNNGTNFTYNFPLIGEPSDKAFYRVGAVEY